MARTESSSSTAETTDVHTSDRVIEVAVVNLDLSGSVVDEEAAIVARISIHSG